MKSYLKQKALRLAVVAVAFMAAAVGLFENIMQAVGEIRWRARWSIARGLCSLAAALWSLDVARLVAVAKNRGWSVRFVTRLPVEALGLAGGMADHATKTILVRSSGLSQRKVAQLLRHEIDHAIGSQFARAPEWLRCMGTWRGAAGLVSFAFETVAGSTLGVTTQVPATYDAAGYGASSISYTLIGEITNIGPIAREYATVSHSPIASRQVTQKKGSFTLPAIELTMAWDQSDAGQDVLRAAEATDAILTFELTKQGGDKRYFTAQVSKVSENFGGADDVDQAVVTLLPQRTVTQYPS